MRRVFLNIVMIASVVFLLTGCKEENQPSQASAAPKTHEEQYCDEDVTVDIGGYVLRTHRKNSPIVAISDGNSGFRSINLSRRENCDVKHVKDTTSLSIGKLSLVNRTDIDLQNFTTYQAHHELTKTLPRIESDEPDTELYGIDNDHELIILSNHIETYNHEPLLALCYFTCKVSYLYDQNLLISYSYRNWKDLREDLLKEDNYQRKNLKDLIVEHPKEKKK
ncbi:MAG: hypothetical protein VX740_09240 [Pseudomonadota bacterium]|nr:hypothetical protein [Pseudomonadota bacterium]MED5423609.1 hypothetical protein [Pseudomonadota bacterium]